jgi:hypothetical protein
MTKFGKAGKNGSSGFLFWTIRFQQLSEQEQDMSYTQRFKDPESFKVCKRGKKHQEANMEEIQARSRSHKNWTVRFWIPGYPFFIEQRV